MCVEVALVDGREREEESDDKGLIMEQTNRKRRKRTRRYEWVDGMQRIALRTINYGNEEEEEVEREQGRTKIADCTNRPDKIG